MIKSYRWKLMTSYLLIISLLLILLGGIAYVNFKDYYLHSLEERLTKEAYLVADMTKYRTGVDNVTRSYQDICNIAALDSDSRVTIINTEGLVWGDSSAQFEKMDIHSNRPEVYAALHGQIGVEMRHSDTVNTDMLYVAVPFDDGQSSGAVRMAMPLAELQIIYKQILAVVFFAVLGCIILAFLLTYILAQYLSRPLRDITEAVKDMARGNLKRRTSYHSEDEMGELALAFNEMGQHIEQNMAEIGAVKNRLEALLNNTVNGIMMIGMEGTVTYANPAAVSLLNLRDNFIGRNHAEMINAYELLEMIDEARESRQAVKRSIILHTLGARIIEATVVPIKNQTGSSDDILLVVNDITELKRLEKVRKDFVANVSHELRTPITSISGFAETLLEEGGKNPDNLKEFSRIIYDEAQRLSILINDLLELSKLESDESSANIQRININQKLRESVGRMKTISGRRNIDIAYHENVNNVEINSDPHLIDQIMMNILDNAIKYSPDGGQIEVELEELNDRIKVSVKDNGVGIPPQDIPRVFERFYRVDKARSRKTGGTGLGLSIVKHALDKLNGQVTVESTEGRGSLFSFSLPK